MIIKKLDIHGFKSFSEKTRILFHPGITAIVGPNGTGKSNIVDAFIWILGGKKIKSLRGERSENVIFNGNTHRTPLSMADVALYLEDNDEEFTLNHRVYRSGEGEYRLNGKAVRLKDIQEFLWKKGVGEKEYFVIEQGSIEGFLSSKPVEKRALLEDAAGTAYYKDKKRQAQNKLENSEENLDRLEDIISEVSKTKISLQRQAQSARRYRKLREKIRRLSLLYYRKKIEASEKNQEEADHLYQKNLHQENHLLSQLKEEEKKLASKRNEVWSLEKQIQEEQQSINSLQSQLSQKETEKNQEKERIDFFEEKRKRAQQDEKDLEHQLTSLNTEKKELEEKLNSLSQTFHHKKEELQQSENHDQKSQQKISQWQEKIEKLRQQYFQQISHHTEAKNERTKIEKEIELIQRQEEKNHTQIQKETPLLEQKEKEISQMKQNLSQTRELFQNKKEELEKHHQSLSRLNSELEKLNHQLARLNKTKDQHGHHLQALKKMEEKERKSDQSSPLPSSLGLLADLMESESPYAPLVDVFWKEETKAQLVDAHDFLNDFPKKNPKGHYLLLSPQTRPNISPELLDDQRVMGLLKSQVQPDPQLEPYLSQLEEGVIVKDLPSAVELWIQYPQFHFITLKGDVLFSSGLLQSGKKKEGIFALNQEIKSVNKKIEQTEQKIRPLDKKIKDKTHKKQNLEEQTQKLEKEKDKLERRLQELENNHREKKEEKEKINQNISLSQQELKSLAQEKSPLLKKKKTIQQKLHKFQEEENSLKQKLEEEQAQFTSFQKKCDQDKNDLYQLKSSVELLQEKIRNLQSQLQSIDKRVQNIQAKQVSLDQEIQASKQDEKKAQENIQILEQKIQHSRRQQKEKETSLKQKESQLKSLQKEQKDMEKRMDQLRKEKEERKEERVKWEIKKAEKDRDSANLEESCWQELKKTPQEIKKEVSLEEIPQTNIEESLNSAQNKLENFKAVNLMAEEEYNSHKKRYDFLMQQKKDLRDSIASTREAIKKIDTESKDQFLKALDEVNKHFQEVFSLLFQGGKADVKLTDPQNPLESGLEITAQPPGKKVQNLSLLSGGEKCLTSLAFFFALFRYRPIPFCILDEVDAALDETNLTRFLNLMKQIKNQTQFIIITHNFKTMEVSDYLYGTTMPEPNITQLYSMKLS
ncbi:chromosome segregation protein SMC [bacterium]|nr:chromosome segregation protein SMC [bacterium]